MKLSFPLPNCMHLAAITQPWEPDLTGADLARIVREADRLGFSAVHVPEHFLVPTEHLDLTGPHWLDVPSGQAFIAGATERIRVNSMLAILPLRHAILTAKALATLDYLSGGRAMLTVGVGWLEDEFTMLGVPFSERGKICDEYLEAMFELFHSDAPSYQGTYVSFDGVGAFEPRPVQQPHPPIWIGGDSDAAIRRAARFGDGWAPWQTKPADIAARVEQIKSHAAWVDRPFEVYYSLSNLSIGDDHVVIDDPDAKAATSADEVLDRIGRLTEIGVTETWVTPPAVPDLAGYIDHLHWVAEEIMPKI